MHPSGMLARSTAHPSVPWAIPYKSPVCNLLLAEVVSLVDAGENVNEVEAAGNTPLHSAAYEGWLEGVQLLLQLGAKINASNNAGKLCS